MTTHQKCYTDDWQRTRPDLAVYLPPLPGGTDEYSDHFHVEYTSRDELFALWTTGSYESSADIRIVFSHSTDEGLTWSPPQTLKEPLAPGMVPGLAFPVFSRSGRIYVFYNQNLGVAERADRWAGVLRCEVSDDGGHTWTPGNTDIPWRHTRYDHPDPAVGRCCIVWQKPIRDARDRVIAGLTRWSSYTAYPRPVGGNRNHLDSACELMRFDNIDDDPDPKDVKITWLPDEAGTIRVSPGIEPDASRGYSLAQEPGIVLLPDGRLWMNMRTVTGRIWYTMSDDDGHSWRPPEILRRRDGGDEMLHPKSPEPIYRMADGRFLLFFHNHDGHAYGATGPWDMDARHPLFMSVGEFRAGAHQPIWFSKPGLLCDTEFVGVGLSGLTWLAMYASYTERNGKRIFWYPDRKHFLLGRYITDAILDSMKDKVCGVFADPLAVEPSVANCAKGA